MDYFPLKVELDYSYSFGALDQYFKALAEGRALGTFCPRCGRTSFPPKLICDVDHSHTEWRELEGTGVVRELTAGVDAHGQESQFALIAMDGADNLSLGRLRGSQFNTGDRIVIDVEDPNAHWSMEYPSSTALLGDWVDVRTQVGQAAMLQLKMSFTCWMEWE